MSTAPKSISIHASDAEVNAAVAEHCAGLRVDRFWPVTDCREDTSKPCVQWYRADGHPTDYPPPYSTSADAVLPLLTALNHPFNIYHWSDNPVEKQWKVHVLDYCESYPYGLGPTFARSACFALLRAHGITVTD